MDSYIYHKVPEKIEGTMLYPLNYFKKELPHLYKEQISKYKGREILMERRIKCLNCFWNDVIFLSPIHPQQIKDEIKKAGFKFDKKQKWFKIPLTKLDQSNLAVIFSKKITEEFTCILFKDVQMDRISILPQETKDYYKECFYKKRKPLPFANAPHLLYKGNIETSGLEVLEV